MKYYKHNFSVEVIGTRYGYLWNDSLGWQDIHFVPSDTESFVQGIKQILRPDFQDGKLTADSTVKITLIKPNRRTIRYFDITLFLSLADLIGDKESWDLQ